ncbi:MAG: retention module-containing protein [Betaproteobacteria bacterium]|nr:retention module-containing protein [Betaproteobacteria bacterium]
MATNTTIGSPVGTVQVAIGTVRILGADGVARSAQEGERVLLNELITTGSDGLVQVRFDNGRLLDLQHDSSATLDSSVVGPEAVAAPIAVGEGQDVAALQAAIAAGADPTKVAEATAAGAPGAGGPEGGGSHEPVILAQANTPGEVTAGFLTQGASITFPTLETEPGLRLPVVEGETLPSEELNAPPVAAPDTNWVQEDIVVAANGNVVQDLAHTGAPSGAFADVADLDLDALAVNAVNGSGLNVGTAIAGVYGTLVLNANGTYTYTVNNASSAVQTLDTGETLTDVFSYSVTDGHNAPASASLTITVFGTNDAPVAHPDTNWVLEDGSAASGNVLYNLVHGGAPSGVFADVADSDVDVEALTVTTTGAFTGTYGTLALNADGIYTYTLNNDNSQVQALRAGETLTDTFSYTASDGTDTSPATLKITIFGMAEAGGGEDGGNEEGNAAPVIGSASTRVSEEGLSTGIPDTLGSTDTTDLASVSGAIPLSDADADALTVTLTAPAMALTSQGVPVTWTGNGTNLLTGMAGEAPIMTIAVTNSGDYTVTLQGPIDHTNPAVEDETAFSVGVRASDGKTTSTGTLAVTVEDDGPHVSLTDVQRALAVDESFLAANDSANFAAVFALLYGADRPGSTQYALNMVGSNGADSGLDDSATGQGIVLVLNGNVVEGHVGSTDGALAFTIMLDTETGEVDLDQLRAVMHASADSPDTSEPAAIGANLVRLVATATDADGDAHSASIDLGRNVSFLDDGPSIIVPAAAQVANEAGASFTGALDFDANVDDNAGADQRGSVTFDAAQDGKDSGLTAGGDPIYLYVSADGKTLTGSTAESEDGVTGTNTVFTVAIDQDGSLGASSDNYTVTMFGTVDNGAGVSFEDLSGTGPAGNPPWKVVESGEPGKALLFTPVAPATSVNSDSDDVGVDSQFIDFDKGLRIDFANLAVAGNPHNPDDYSFVGDGHYTINHFAFAIDQIAEGSVADLTLRAYDADEDDPIQSTLGDDAQSAITAVQVYDAAHELVAAATGDGTTGGIEFEFDPSGAVTVRGLVEGYSVVTTTADGYDRIEITNAGTGGDDGKFSLNDLEIQAVDTGMPVDTSFDVNLTDADGDSMPATISVTFEPSGMPTLAGEDADNALYGGEGDDAGGVGGEVYVAGSSGPDDDGGNGFLVANRGTLGSGSDGPDLDTSAQAPDGINALAAGVPNAEVVDVRAVLEGVLPPFSSAADLDGYVTLDTVSSPGHTIVMVDPAGGGDYLPLVTLTDVTNMTLQELLENQPVAA